ncbi:MAG: metallophosphoesterase [Salaquimonas sp.]|nr:metallophosphoesterase [Salaquimonas sp.]
MIIAQISDTHIALDVPDAGQRIADFERAIADINSLDPAPDVIFHTGDVVHNGRAEEYAEAVRILDKGRVPVFVIPGNKDDRANMRVAFADRGYFDPNDEFIEYTLEDYPVRLIAVDTLNTASNKGDFCVERARRLAERIEADTTKPIAVFAHHPPFMVQVGPEPLNFETPEMVERLRRTLQRSTNVIRVISGHVHRGTAGHVGEITATVMPSIATTLRWGEYPSHMKDLPVYHIHRFDPDFGPAGGFSTETRIVEEADAQEALECVETCAGGEVASWTGKTAEGFARHADWSGSS